MAPQTQIAQGTLAVITPTLRRWVDGFIISRRAGGLATSTITFYRKRLAHFTDYCEGRGAAEVEAIDPTLIREYLLALGEAGHNAGGVHGFFRIIRALFLWYETEAAPEGWRNPIRKVAAPKVPEKILPPVEMADVAALLDSCGNDRLGLRDRAVLLTLIDCGLRANELLSLDVSDFDSVTGALTVRHGKGGKGRVVFAGHKTRKAIRAWLKERGGGAGALFCARDGRTLDYNGLRAAVKRLARRAGVPYPPLHSFRRGFALAMLRDGCDIVTLSRLMGHSDLSLIRRYTKQNSDDLREAAEKHSPADRL